MPGALARAFRSLSPRNPGQPFALTRWFAVVGATAIGLFGIAMSWMLSNFLETRMLERDAALSRDFVQGIANMPQVSAFLRAPSATAPVAATDFFERAAAMPDVLRANIYAPDRHVLWSSRPELMGKTFASNDELDQCLRGEVVVNLDEDEEAEPAPKAEHQGLFARETPFVEDYLPVFDEHSHRLVAVIELYRQPVALFAAIDQGRRLIRLGAAGGGVLLFLVLVWFVRWTERTLRDQQHQLVAAETLAIVGEMAAAVAHSTRNPLVSIRTSAELQREKHGDEEGVQAEIMRNVDRIEHLVRTLLTYAGDPASAGQSSDIGAVLREAAQRFAPDFSGHDKHLDLDLPDDLGTVAADPVILAQVFNSLLANAAEATSAGDAVRLLARREGRRARIELFDTGHGIDPDRLRDVFKPFFTTKARGLGMGLPLARRIARRLGGDIEIAHHAPRGTVVRIWLPLTQEGR